MAVASHPAGHVEGLPASHGAHTRNRLPINRLGLWLFILSDAVFFGALLSTRYYLRGVHTPSEVSQLLGFAITSVLLLSSVTAYRAETFAIHRDQKGFRRNILYTILLGLIFVVGVGIEWTLAFKHFPPNTAYGTILFTTTGIHAFHVMTGVLGLTVLYRLGKDGRFTKGHFWPVEGVVKYWHFVDVVWMFIFPTLYLVN